MGGGREVEADATGLEAQEHDPRTIDVLLEGAHHLVSLLAAAATVQERGLEAEHLVEVDLEPVAHLLELREDQGLLAAFEHFLQHVREAFQLAAARLVRSLLLEELAGVVADLLEVRKQRQDAPATLDVCGRGQILVHLLDSGLVEDRLLLGELGVDLHLVLLGQVLDDGPIGLQAAQDEGAHALAQFRGGVRVPVLLDGSGETFAEARLIAEIACKCEGHDGPEF